MGIEENKKTAIGLLESFAVFDVDAGIRYTTDDFTWVVPGNPEKFPLAGPLDKANFLGLYKLVRDLMPKGMHIKPLVLTAEDDRVAVEAESYAETTTGKIYNNHYHFLMHFNKDGKINAVKEYLDTMHTNEIFCGQG